MRRHPTLLILFKILEQLGINPLIQLKEWSLFHIKIVSHSTFYKETIWFNKGKPIIFILNKRLAAGMIFILCKKLGFFFLRFFLIEQKSNSFLSKKKLEFFLIKKNNGILSNRKKKGFFLIEKIILIFISKKSQKNAFFLLKKTTQPRKNWSFAWNLLSFFT